MPDSTHDSVSDLSAQLHALLDQGWEQDVVSQLPADYEQQARRTGAFVRARGLRCVADLLRELLAYVLCAPSFRQLGAQVVVRLAVHQLPLCNEHGQPLDVLAWLKAQDSGQHSCPVTFEHEGRRFAGRLIACSLPQEAAERARAKERKKAVKQQRHLKEETLYLCG